MSEEKPYSETRDWLSKRVWKEAERRALDQARRVPWKRLAEAADQYTEWHVFTLWLRAVVDAAPSIPDIVKSELESRVPHSAPDVQIQTTEDSERAGRPGTRLWQEVSQWAEANIFRLAKTENWLEAVRYFSSISIRSMKAWAHWERKDDTWQRASPAAFPSYKQWRADVDSVKKLTNPGSVCQRVLDAMNQVTAQEFMALEAAFFEFTAFSLWMELVIEDKRRNRQILEHEILFRYKGFESPDGFSSPEKNVHALSEWILNHELAEAREQPTVTALSYQIRNHPRYHALRRYAQLCHRAWQESPPLSVPPFELWTQFADRHMDFDPIQGPAL